MASISEIKKTVKKVKRAAKITSFCAEKAIKIYTFVPKYDKITGIDTDLLIENLKKSKQEQPTC